MRCWEQRGKLRSELCVYVRLCVCVIMWFCLFSYRALLRAEWQALITAVCVCLFVCLFVAVCVIVCLFLRSRICACVYVYGYIFAYFHVVRGEQTLIRDVCIHVRACICMHQVHFSSRCILEAACVCVVTYVAHFHTRIHWYICICALSRLSHIGSSMCMRGHTHIRKHLVCIGL